MLNPIPTPTSTGDSAAASASSASASAAASVSSDTCVAYFRNEGTNSSGDKVIQFQRCDNEGLVPLREDDFLSNFQYNSSAAIFDRAEVLDAIKRGEPVKVCGTHANQQKSGKRLREYNASHAGQPDHTPFTAYKSRFAAENSASIDVRDGVHSAVLDGEPEDVHSLATQLFHEGSDEGDGADAAANSADSSAAAALSSLKAPAPQSAAQSRTRSASSATRTDSASRATPVDPTANLHYTQATAARPNVPTPNPKKGRTMSRTTAPPTNCIELPELLNGVGIKHELVPFSEVLLPNIVISLEMLQRIAQRQCFCTRGQPSTNMGPMTALRMRLTCWLAATTVTSLVTVQLATLMTVQGSRPLEDPPGPAAAGVEGGDTATAVGAAGVPLLAWQRHRARLPRQHLRQEHAVGPGEGAVAVAAKLESCKT